MRIMNVTQSGLKNLFLGLLAITTITFVTGCSDDDNDSKDIVPEKEVASAAYTINLSYSDDELALFDLTAEYTTPTGEKQTEPVTKDWTKTVVFETFPATFSYKVTLKLKEGVELTKERYKMGLVKNGTYEVQYKDGSVEVRNGLYDTKQLTIAVGKVKEYAADQNKKKSSSFTISLNDDKSDIVINSN